MSSKNIIITDILGLEHIDDNTPLIIIKNISSRYLIQTEYSNIYWINVYKLHNILKKKLSNIHIFIPLGQIKTNKKQFTSIFANTQLIPTSNTYEKLKHNEWIAIIKKNGKIIRSVGTFKSSDKPTVYIPVFPQLFLHMDNGVYSNKSIYKDLYTHKSIDKMILNRYMFNIDKSNLKMIDTTGNISNIHIPIPYTSHDEKEIKTYFTTQGIISNNNTYVIPDAYDNTLLNNCDVMYNNDIDNDKKLVLRQKDNPWFLNYDIVGNVINTKFPHKVTGLIETPQFGIDTDNQYIDNNIDNNFIILIICLLILIFIVCKVIKNR